MKKLQELEKEISGGTTATVVLIYNNKIYVANVGKLTFCYCLSSANCFQYFVRQIY